MRLFAGISEKPKNDKADMKESGHHGFVLGLIAYVILAAFFGTIGNSFLIVFLQTLPANVIGFIITFAVSICPCSLIALLVYLDQKPLRGGCAESLAALTVLIAMAATCLMGVALYNTIRFIASIPPDAPFREYSDSYIGLMRLWFVSIGLGFFFGLGVLGGMAFLKQEPDKPKNDTL